MAVRWRGGWRDGGAVMSGEAGGKASSPLVTQPEPRKHAFERVLCCGLTASQTAGGWLAGSGSAGSVIRTSSATTSSLRCWKESGGKAIYVTRTALLSSAAYQEVARLVADNPLPIVGVHLAEAVDDGGQEAGRGGSDGEDGQRDAADEVGGEEAPVTGQEGRGNGAGAAGAWWMERTCAVCVDSTWCRAGMCR